MVVCYQIRRFIMRLSNVVQITGAQTYVDDRFGSFRQIVAIIILVPIIME